MFYVSRYVSRRKIGVVDSDDMVENILDYDEVYHYVCELGIDIAGIKTRVLKNGQRRIVSVDVYQHKDWATAAQAKQSLINGVSIKTNDYMITSISAVGTPKEKSVRVRLSDYGSYVAKYAVQSVTTSLILVLDDNIRFTKMSFSNCSNRVMFDLTEVKSWKTAEILYSIALERGYGDAFSRIDDRIIDIGERVGFWKACYYIKNGESNDKIVKEIRDLCKDSDVSKRLMRKFGHEFDALADVSLTLRDYKDKSARGCADYIRLLHCYDRSHMEELQSQYKVALLECLPQALNVFRYVLAYEDDNRALQCYRYISCCGDALQTKKIFGDLICRVNRFAAQYA